MYLHFKIKGFIYKWNSSTFMMALVLPQIRFLSNETTCIFHQQNFTQILVQTKCCNAL